MNANYLKNIYQRLKNYNSKKQRYVAITGLLNSLLTISIVFVFFSVLESIFHFNSTIRTILFLVFIAFLFFILVINTIIPLLKSLNLIGHNNIKEAAGEIGKYYPQIKDELLDVLQLYDKNAENNYSQELADAALESIYKKIYGLNFENNLSNKKLISTLRATISGLSVVLFLIFFLPFLNSASLRLIDFNSEFVTPPKFNLKVSPGNKSILKGQSQKIIIIAGGERPNQIFLFTKTATETEFEKEVLKYDSLDIFSSLKSPINHSFEYYAKAENIESSHYKIKVLNPPLIKDLLIKIIPPNYTGLNKIIQYDNGNISLLPGSKVEVEFNSTKELSAGHIVYSSGSRKKINIKGKRAGVIFEPKKKDEYFFEIIDTAGYKNNDPISYSINLIEDQYPALVVRSPKKTTKVMGNELLPVDLKLSDDYGLNKLILNYRLSNTEFGEPEKNYKSINIALKKNSIEQELYYSWELAKLYLAVGDEITYYFELFDNDNVSGPKSVKSPFLKLLVPSLNETFAEVEKIQNDSGNKLTKTLEETKKLDKEINKLSNKLKRDSKKISWEEKEKIQSAVKKFEELSKNVDEIKSQIDKAKQKLDNNKLLSNETLKKYNELQKLMDELSSPEMKEALKKLQEMMQQMNRENVQKSFQNFKFNENAFKKSLERTVNLLKRIQIEQKVDEVSKLSRELEKRQRKLNKEIENAGQSDTDKNKEFKNRQDGITKDLKHLTNKMNELKKRMDEVSKMPVDQMNNIIEEMKNQNNEQLSNEASKILEKRQTKQAADSQNQIANNLNHLSQQLSEMKKNLQRQSQFETMTEMMKIISQVIILSKQQEQLKQESRNIAPNSIQKNSNARKQEEIKSGLGKLLQQMTKLSQKTFAITPEMAKSLGKALRNMAESQKAMQNNNGNAASIKQGEAMGELNEAAILMNKSLQSMMQPGGQGGGMMSLMQQFQKLSDRQMSLNQLTQKFGLNGRMTQQQMSQLNKLIQEQSLIKKSMQELNREARNSGVSKKLTINFERVIQEMKEVITGMKSEKIDDELKDKQNKILSKLLDAQRSINERDYEKRRESNSGKDFARKSPHELELEKNKENEQIRRELLNSIKEGYSSDYLEVIRKYFEALEKRK